MYDPKFFDDEVKPKLKEIAALCEKQGCEFQAIVAYKAETLEAQYFGNYEFMVPAKLECLRQDLQNHLACQKNGRQCTLPVLNPLDPG
jgi:hypothetical protein